MILRKVAIGEVSVARIKLQSLGQSQPNAPRDAPETLRARRLRIEDATETERAEHTIDAGLAGVPIDADLREERAEPGRRIILGDRARFVVTLRANIRSVEQLCKGRAVHHTPVGQGELILRDTRFLGHLLSDGLASDEYRRTDRCRTPAAARTRTTRMVRVAKIHQHLVDGQTEHLTCKLGEDGIGTRPDVGHIGLDKRRAIGLERDPCLRLRDVVNARGARHARPDPPFAFAFLHRLARTLIPAEGFGSFCETLGKRVIGERQILCRMAFRNVAKAQFDGIDADFLRQHVHRGFEGRHPDRFARSPNGSSRHAMDASHFQFEQAVLAAIKELARLKDRFRELLPGKVGNPCFVPETDELAVFVRRKAQPLPRLRAPHDALKHLLAAHNDAHRTLQFHRSHASCHRLFAHAELRAETAADIARDQPDLFFVEIEAVGQFRDIVIQHLQRCMNCQFVAIPFGDCGMRLHRRGIVTFRRDHDVHAMRCGVHRSGQIAHLRAVALGFRIGLFRIDDSIVLGAIFDLQVLCRIARFLEGARDDDRNRLSEISDLSRRLRRGFARRALGSPRGQARVVDNGLNARHIEDGRRIDFRDLAFYDRRSDDHAFEAPVDLIFGGVGRGSGDLRQTVRA